MSRAQITDVYPNLNCLLIVLCDKNVGPTGRINSDNKTYTFLVFISKIQLRRREQANFR